MAETKSRPHYGFAHWLRLQRSLAEKTGLTLLTLDGESSVIGRIENNNSICEAMLDSPEHARLCRTDCEGAYNNALAGKGPVHYRCHAGLDCFAVPVRISKRQLVVLGGRAFTSASEYAQFLARYDDLEAVHRGECFGNVAFAHAGELRSAAELVASSAECHFQSAQVEEAQEPAEPETQRELMNAHLEIIRLADQLESKNRAIAQFYNFIRGLGATLDSQKVYQAVLAKFSEMMKAGRSSLMILNEQSNELALEAALGANLDATGPIRVKLGEGIAGGVMATGAALLVRDADSDERVPDERRGNYRSKSFISFPITLGPRKVGVLNLTDRNDGAAYGAEDLTLLELLAPQLALIIDRTEWHRKAETYQKMSLTDPLTGLPNRRYLEERLFEEVERSKRHATPLSFMIIDVDHFKSYNDIYGHTNADDVLVKTAQILRRSVRAIDMPARFAGDEFCIVLPETEQADAARAAERLRKAVYQAEYRSDQGELMKKVTISIGVSSFCSSRQSSLAIIESADRALYQAKTRGRNCVAVYEGADAV